MAGPLFSLLLANVQSQENKRGKIRLRLIRHRKSEAVVLIFTETWLHPNILDQAFTFNGQTLFCANRTKDCGKMTRGGHSQSGWTVFTRCQVFKVKMSTILSAQRIK